MPKEQEVLRFGDREVVVTNPGKVFFEAIGATKLDLVRFYLAVAPGALAAAGGRPMALKRFVNGAAGEAFFQKRAPEGRPEWLRTVTLSFPSGRTADEIVVDDSAVLAWVLNPGCIDPNPHPVRADTWPVRVEAKFDHSLDYAVIGAQLNGAIAPLKVTLKNQGAGAAVRPPLQPDEKLPNGLPLGAYIDTSGQCLTNPANGAAILWMAVQNLASHGNTTTGP